MKIETFVNNLNEQGYQLMPINEKDMFTIKKWRNKQIKFLRQKKKLTDRDQKKYFNEVVLPSYNKKKPQLMLFKLAHKGVFVGYGGITNIDWVSKRAEISFLDDNLRADDETTYKEDFTAFLLIIKKVVFEYLKFQRVFTETYDIRPAHIKILENNDFLFEGRLVRHEYIAGKFVDSLIHGCINKKYEFKR